MSRCSIAAWCLMVLCSIIFFTYSAGQNRSVTQLQKDIAGEIIRFHVRANSDTDADQQLTGDKVYAFIISITGQF